MKFRKKPVVIDAVQLPAENDETVDGEGFAKALHDLLDGNAWECERYGAIAIHTLEGTMRGDPGDWIIRGIKGECYPCKPDIFAATYEPQND